MTVVSVGREPAVSGMRNISCWGRGTGLLTDGSAGASTSELFSSVGVDSVADGTTTEKVLSVIYILGIYKNCC